AFFLSRQGAAPSCLAVPAQRQVAGLAGLDPMEHVEHDLAFVGVGLVITKVATVGVSPPDAHGDVRHQPSSSSARSSSRIGGSGSRVSESTPPNSRTT